MQWMGDIVDEKEGKKEGKNNAESISGHETAFALQVVSTELHSRTLSGTHEG